MFIPLYDTNEKKHIKVQWMTIGLIAFNVLAYIFLVVPANIGDLAINYLAFFPVIGCPVVTGVNTVLIADGLPSYVTYSFLHADLLHLGGNMLFLWVFGDNVEDAMGHVKFLIFYCLCAAAGAYAHSLVDPCADYPLIGASGAVAGIVAAYLILHPKVRVWVLLFSRIPLPIQARWVLGFWVLFQFVMIATDTEGQVAWSAHIGGILMGAVLIPFLKYAHVPLFDKNIN